MIFSLLSRTTALAVLFLLVSLVFPGIAPAMTKCLCNDGSIAWSDEDDGDDSDCNDTCDDQGGGGRVWHPGDPDGGAEDVQGGAVVVPPREGERPTERRGR
jgi:hypothetical protein